MVCVKLYCKFSSKILDYLVNTKMKLAVSSNTSVNITCVSFLPGIEAITVYFMFS